jgi:hypothetical protein
MRFVTALSQNSSLLGSHGVPRWSIAADGALRRGCCGDFESWNQPDSRADL